MQYIFLEKTVIFMVFLAVKDAGTDVMLCYVMLCYVMLCYVMLCYVMLCYVMLCYVMLCYVMLFSSLPIGAFQWPITSSVTFTF